MFLKKSLGQNFLIDKNIIKKIINLIEIKNKNIIEIGPGKGALTKEILKKNPKSLVLIEKDNKLYQDLKNEYLNKDKIKIFNKDILDFNFNILKKKNFIVFGNLPYNISSQILIKFIKLKKWPPDFNDIIFMFQKELSDKIIATFPSKNYGRISIITNYRLILKKKFNVSANCFFPKPKIESTILHFRPKLKPKIKIQNIDNLEKITNLFFSNKRKMIKKNLQKLLNDKKINLIDDLNLKSRPENLNPETYYKITNLYEA